MSDNYKAKFEWKMPKHIKSVRLVRGSNGSLDLYDDLRPAIATDPYFGFQGLWLREQILPALCGPFGRVMP